MVKGIYEMPNEKIDVATHLKNSNNYICLESKQEHKTEHNETFRVYYDWSSLIQGKPEPKILTNKNRCVWTKTQGYCKTN